MVGSKACPFEISHRTYFVHTMDIPPGSHLNFAPFTSFLRVGYTDPHLHVRFGKSPTPEHFSLFS